MDNQEQSSYEKLMSLSKEELEKIFAKMSLSDINDMLEKLNEGSEE